jgi:pyridoxamine 5'-phosphate oxidase
MGSNQREGVGGDDPLAWFVQSFERARSAESFDASRAALASVDGHGQPSLRFVLVKQVDERGFVFFTNYDSRKARELTANPVAALAFHWASSGEQIRIEGAIERVSAAESDAYFATRPRGSQLGAWASAQSKPIENRAALENALHAVSERYPAGGSVPRPAHWGGFRLVPSRIEFWQDQRDRLHDRFLFERVARESRAWTRTRLQP